MKYKNVRRFFAFSLIVLTVIFPILSNMPHANAVSPAAPPGATATTTSFTQSTPVAIPTGPAVVTSTVAVATADTFLLDVDVTTFITHTFPGDLDVTVQSPAGTVVTLTTDNAGTNDNVFNGTVWDDDANPAGQVPYTTNNGIATDHAYVNLTLASPLVPEEALGAFIGEDPNGTWTLTVSDDTAIDGGSIDNWTVTVTTLNVVPTLTATTIASTNVPVAIPTGPAVVTSTLDVTGLDTYLFDINVTTFITHTFPGDLDITVQSPAGTVVTLTTDNAGTNDDVFNGTVWDDDANPAGQVPYTTNNGIATDHAYVNLTLASPLVPEEAFGAFIGEDPNGTWTLTVSDDTAIDGGSINNWSVTITTAQASVVGYGSTPAPSSTINIGSSPVGTPISTVLSIFETGSATLTVDFVSITGANAADFGLSGATFPLTILDGDPAVPVTVQCTPSAEGLLTATLTLSSNDPLIPAPSYSLECTGTPAGSAPVPGPVFADPALSKIGVLGPGQLGLPGEQITWIITVSNFSSATLADVVVSDTLISELRIDNATTSQGTISVNGQTVTAAIGTVNNGQQVEIRIVTTVLRNPADPFFENTAQMTASGLAPVTATAFVSGVSGLPDTGYPPRD